MKNDLNLHAHYVALQKASGIKVGDTVKVLRKANSHEMGWNNKWTVEMDEFVGKTFIVEDLRAADGIGLMQGNCGPYNFPFFVLEMVKPKIPNTKIIKIDDGFDGTFDVEVALSCSQKRVIITVNGCSFYLSEWQSVGKEADAFRKLHQYNK